MTERPSLPFRVLRFLNDHVMLFPFKKEAMDKFRDDPWLIEKRFWIAGAAILEAIWLLLILPPIDPILFATVALVVLACCCVLE